jgi:hypothetical protein
MVDNPSLAKATKSLSESLPIGLKSFSIISQQQYSRLASSSGQRILARSTMESYPLILRKARQRTTIFPFSSPAIKLSSG